MEESPYSRALKIYRIAKTNFVAAEDNLLEHFILCLPQKYRKDAKFNIKYSPKIRSEMLKIATGAKG